MNDPTADFTDSSAGRGLSDALAGASTADLMTVLHAMTAMRDPGEERLL